MIHMCITSLPLLRCAMNFRCCGEKSLKRVRILPVHYYYRARRRLRPHLPHVSPCSNAKPPVTIRAAALYSALICIHMHVTPFDIDPMYIYGPYLRPNYHVTLGERAIRSTFRAAKNVSARVYGHKPYVSIFCWFRSKIGANRCQSLLSFVHA